MAKTYLATRADISDMATNTNLSAHKNDKNNPHSVTATQLGAEVTSNRTDDIASNAEDSSRYPSTKGVVDYVGNNYLPLTGGTTTGRVRVEASDSSGFMVERPAVNARMAAWVSDSGYCNLRATRTDTGVYSGLFFPNNFDAIDNLVRLELNDGTSIMYRNLFGEHNFVITINNTTDDIDEYLKQGSHFKWYRTGSNTLNTPYKKGLTGYVSSLILSYASTATTGHQVAFIGGSNLIFVRSMFNGNISAWQKVGGDKPTGTYTGTGNGTTQNISVGGTGSALIVTSTAGSALVTPNGATAWANSTGDYYSQHTGSSLSASEISYSNGVLKIASTSGYVNNSGTTYTYQVL